MSRVRHEIFIRHEGHTRHKVFISYHHDDQKEVDEFIQTFDSDRKVFIAHALGMSEDMHT